MKRRAFTLIELLLVIAIALIFIAAIGTLAQRDRATTTVPTAPAGAAEVSGTYEVHIVPIPGMLGGDSAHVRDALAKWLFQNQGKKVVAVIRNPGGADMVILALQEAK